MTLRLRSLAPFWLVLALGMISAAVSAPPAAAQPFTCTSDASCGGAEMCVGDRCVSSRCNADTDCVNRRPFCSGGFCRAASSCSSDGDCAAGVGGRGCVGGTCTDVDCVNDADCRSGQSCVAHECRDCVSNAQCGEHGVCTNNSCTCVECTRAGQCAFDQRCSPEHRCVDFCPAGQLLVQASDDNRVCKTCVNPDTHPRCNDFPGCPSFQGRICAQGFCIRRCALEPPDFDELLDDFPSLRYRPDPNGRPDCPACQAVFDLAPLRTALERAGIAQPVTVRLFHPSGRILADLGTFKANRGSWASVPLRAQPRLHGPLGKTGGCGFSLEVRTAAPGAPVARTEICLKPR